ncbi:hypothetical protein ASA1KI_40990 [Opitutales bacterium ASA1]|uniref:hypothetical protein n=1 Tax=Congregicoccus parvus TaxID=3081749 RepID=UPI002B2870CC|nr:hypothetical protein ASA1KI_40990 [Opitutales bacterium ASA1]
MSLLKTIEFLRSRLRLLVRASFGVLALLIVLDAIPAVVDKHHAHTAVERFPGFWSIFGFVACVLIIFLSKWYGKAGIMTREDRYDE